jgi:hypothetical protein
LIGTYHQHILVDLLAVLNDIVLRGLRQLISYLLAYLGDKDIVYKNLESLYNILIIVSAFFRTLIGTAEAIYERVTVALLNLKFHINQLTFLILENVEEEISSVNLRIHTP